jgi:hypothetical protein
MQMSERQWRVLSLLERLDRGEVTVGEVATSLRRSRRQVQRMRKRFAGGGAAGLVHGNAGRCPKHRTPEEVREQIVMLRRGKYDGFNDQHFTEKLVEVEGLGLSRETIRRILREAGIGSPRKRRPPKHRQRRERKAQAGQMILWDGSEHDWLEGRGPRLCLMGAIDDATGELLPGVHFTEQESTVGYLRVLRDILKEKGIPHTVYGDRHSSLRRNDKHWTLEEELAGRQEPTQVGRVLANLGIETRYALSAPAKGRVERLWGVLQDRLISELRLAGASTRGQANKLLSEYRHAHNKRFAVAPQDTQPAWRKAPTDHTKLLDLCALHYVRKVHKNHTVRIHGRVIDIPRRPDAAYATYAGKDVLVKHLLSGDYRVFYDGQCIAWANGSRPKPSTGQQPEQRQDKTRDGRRGSDISTEQLTGDIFTLL